MRSSFTLVLVVCLVAWVMVGCAPGANQLQGTAGNQDRIAGFWMGIWQGFIAPFVFVISLFNHKVSIYEIHNNGGWYNFGYLFGLACFFGGSGNRATRRK
jgi:hypothetical protein